MIVLRLKLGRLSLIQTRLVRMLVGCAREALRGRYVDMSRLLLQLHLLRDCILHVHILLAYVALFFWISEGAQTSNILY